MNYRKIRMAIFAIFITLCTASVQAQVQIRLPYPKFERPSIPDNLTQEAEINDWMAKHYWDKFNFLNTENLKNPELTFPIITNYIGQLNTILNPMASIYLKETLQKAKTNEEVYNHMANAFNDILGNTRSPYRNDEYLIAVLEDLLSVKNLSETDKNRYELSLTMAKKNRVDSIATNIGFIDTSSKSDSLHSIKAEIILLMFYSPGCHACEIAEARLKQSEIINNWLDSGDLKVLVYAPEANEEDWKKYQSHIPDSWINGYDPDQSVWNQRLYDIQGFPTIYLLDENKRVILKDVGINDVEKYLMQLAMSLPGM